MEAKQSNYDKMPVEEFLTILRGFIGKTLYAVGGFCEKLTRKRLDSKAKRYPEWYHQTKCAVAGYRHLTNYEYLLRFVDKGYFMADCCGLIKGIQAGYRPDGTEGRMTPEIDIPIEKMVAELTDVRSNVLDAPDGYMMFFKSMGHVMVVSEAGHKDIESAPTTNGVKEVPIGYQPLSRMGGAGRLPWIDYGESTDKIDEDGLWGMQTTRKAQRVFGTYEDGIVSRQLPRFKSRLAGCVSGWHFTGVASDVGSDLIRAMQKWLKVDVDGHCGTKTIMALQKKMGTPVDGVFDKPSQCIKAFQKWLNEH